LIGLFVPEYRLTLIELVIASLVLATVFWPLNSWTRRRYQNRFGPDRSTWSEVEDEEAIRFEGAIRSSDGSWNHGRFEITGRVLRWMPRFSAKPRWVTDLAETSVVGVRSPQPREWWAVNRNCVIVTVDGSAGRAELVLFPADLKELREKFAHLREFPN
jgi:hypothetical protein